MPWKSEIKERFGERVTFDPTERLLYSHDVAVLPEAVRKMFRTMPDAVVQPVNREEVVFLTELARNYQIPLVPRGAGTSGYGGAVPAKGGIIVDFSRFRNRIEIDAKAMTVTVDPGVNWLDLEEALRAEGLALRLYPTSAPGSTVAGWVAEGGAGIGSYEYGYITENVLAVETVLPSGDVRQFTGDELELVTGTEGITGFLTGVTLAVREADEDIPVLASFPGPEELHRCLMEVSGKGLPLWHVVFSTPEFVRKREEAAQKCLLPQDLPMALFVYPKKRQERVHSQLLNTIEANGGTVLSEEMAAHEWEERFYPMRLKRLGPSLIPSEAVVPLARVNAALREIGSQVQGIAIEGTLISGKDVALLGFLVGNQRGLAYTIGYGKSLMVADIAKKHGGRPYTVGLFFTNEVEEALGRSRVERIRSFKQEVDPAGLLNPGKILPSGSTALSMAMKAARIGRPLMGVAEKLAGDGSGESKDPARGKLPKNLAYEAYACAQCGYCRNVCTLYGAREWESSSPRGKWYLLREYVEGRAKITQEMVDVFLMCTTCKRCNDVCQVNIPIQEMWDEIRGFLIKEQGYQTFPAFEMMGASFNSELNIWASLRENRDAWVPEDVKIAERSEIGYWAGCTASFVERDIAQNAVHILKEGGLEFTYLGKDEACCGVPFLVAGKWDIFEKALRHNVNEIKKRGIKTLVISCPGCWVAFEHYYAHWTKELGIEWDVEIKHITEVAAQLVREGKLQFQGLPETRLTWHDPCHIGRHGGIYEAPREVLKAIPGVELVEMASNRDKGRCCGSVLTRISYPDISNTLAKQRLTEAVEVDAQAVVTTCPCCEFQLRVGGKASGVDIPVIDFAAVVAKALGYESEDPTELVHARWEVFDAAIKAMSFEGMVEMMHELMPGMFDMMPSPMDKGMEIMKKIPSPGKHAMIAMMDSIMPMMMPQLMNKMLPKMLPEVQKLMERKIPGMPDSMKQLMPKMLPEIMKALLPAALPKLIPVIKPKMMELMKEQIFGRRPA